MLNGRIEHAGALRISPLSEGFQFGYGVFTTLRLVGGRPAMMTEHHGRLTVQAAALDLGRPSEIAELKERCLMLAREAGACDGALRITWFRDVEGTSELIQLRPTTYAPELYRLGARLYRVEAEGGATLSGLKTIAYLRFLRAKRAAAGAGFDEALLVTAGGRVLEGATTNVFCVLEGVLATPPESEGLLPGVVRGAILKGSCGVGALERAITWDELLGAQEVFVTNSVMGVMPVRGLGDRLLASAGGPITREVTKGWAGLEAASLE